LWFVITVANTKCKKQCSVVTNKKRNKGLLGEYPTRKVSVTEKVSFIHHHLNIDGP
jgi:hypothetical protein